MKKIAIVLALVLLVSVGLVGCKKEEKTANMIGEGIVNGDGSTFNTNTIDFGDIIGNNSYGSSISPGSVGSSSGSIIGIWSVTSAEMSGMTFDADALAGMGMDYMDIEFKSGGNALFMDMEVTYSEIGNKVDLSVSGIAFLTLVKEGNTLFYEEEGTKMIFTKGGSSSSVSSGSSSYSSGSVSSSVLGVWTLTGAEWDGMTLDASTLAEFGMGEMTLEFKSNGVVSLGFDGESEDATYIEIGNEIEISEDGEEVMTLVKDGNKLVAEQDDMKMIFTK